MSLATPQRVTEVWAAGRDRDPWGAARPIPLDDADRVAVSEALTALREFAG